MEKTKVADLTIEEFKTLLQDMIEAAIQQAIAPQQAPLKKRPPLDLPVDDLGPWPEQKLNREEFYDDKRPPLDIPVIDVGAWPENFSFDREDMYGDNQAS